jgi:hypothetical protein
VDGGRTPGVQIELVAGDALEVDADVLVLKHAQALHGLDESVHRRYRDGRPGDLPGPGGALFAPSPPGVAATEVLFIGTRSIGEFDYADVREFGRRAMHVLAMERPDVRHVALTLHGVGFGLDEQEACEAELAGLLDVVEHQRGPRALERISVIEQDAGRAQRLRQVVAMVVEGADLIPGVGIDPQPDRSRLVGEASNAKPHVFVAMPFDTSMDDLYHYGIQPAVRSGGYLCERADKAVFTGDVLSWVKRRISSGSMVVADLTGANPNVYLEVGYAWGAKIPTILLARAGQELLFDVQGQKCLLYQSIRDLETRLRQEVASLRPSRAAGDRELSQL